MSISLALTWLAIRFPVRFWAAYTPQTISVRRRSDPRKSSTKPGVPPVFSFSMTRRIIATVSVGLTRDLRPRRSMDFAACSSLPFLTSHQGLSGAKKRRIARGVGNSHCRAIGILFVRQQTVSVSACLRTALVDRRRPTCRRRTH